MRHLHPKVQYGSLAVAAQCGNGHARRAIRRMKPLPPLLLCAWAAPGVGESPCRQGRDYIDLIGGVTGEPVAEATGPAACCTACQGDADCESFSWIHVHARDVPGLSAPPGCWLKRSGVPWQQRSHVPQWGNRAEPPASGSARPNPGLAGSEPYYAVVGGSCSTPDSCNASSCNAGAAPGSSDTCVDCVGGAVHIPSGADRLTSAAGGSMGTCSASGECRPPARAPPGPKACAAVRFAVHNLGRVLACSRILAGNLASGEACVLGCPDGFYGDGPQPSCSDGALYFNVSCQPCTGERPPPNARSTAAGARWVPSVCTAWAQSV